MGMRASGERQTVNTGRDQGIGMDIKAYLEDKRSIINQYLKSYFAAPSLPRRLHESVTYSLLSDGKRIRPAFALASYEACGGHALNIIPQAAALELIHAYSLIHDDLPAMDNDDLRRGQPTNHKVFGEGIAVLAGDGLLTEAFFMMTNIGIQGPLSGARHTNKPRPDQIKPPKTTRPPITYRLILRAIRDVAFAAGFHGMVGGQAQDILSESSQPDRETLNFIHSHKTAALIAASVRLGPILANSGMKKLRALTLYGENIGLAFQIVDDILDVEGTSRETGKTAGSDSKKNKLTYPSLFGVDGARQTTNELLAVAEDALKDFSSEADPLREIARYLVARRK